MSAKDRCQSGLVPWLWGIWVCRGPLGGLSLASVQGWDVGGLPLLAPEVTCGMVLGSAWAELSRVTGELGKGKGRREREIFNVLAIRSVFVLHLFKVYSAVTKTTGVSKPASQL